MASSMHAALKARHTAYNCREGTLASVFRSMGDARSTRPAMPSWPRQRRRLGTSDPKPGDESPHTGIAPSENCSLGFRSMGWMPSKHVTAAPSRSAAQHRPHGPHAGADAVTLRAELVMQRCESGSLVLWASAAGCQQAQNSEICAAAPRQPNPAAAPNGGYVRASPWTAVTRSNLAGGHG